MSENIDKKIQVYIAVSAYKPRPTLDELGLEEVEEMYNTVEDPTHVRFSFDSTNEKYVLVSIESKDNFPESKEEYIVGDGTSAPHKLLSPASYYVMQLYNSENKKVRITLVSELIQGNEMLSYIRDNFLQRGYKIHKAKNTQVPVKALRELKSLLDDGIITQEDFDKKKKQLLGI
ncbi:SHOCT domain-containing protein [Lactobacillus crispatus]|uniref:SHOCT domain-containing protein n=1 Tax=Lactobacillus crispatus TaxID=47770 RepID=UPI001239F325|nr:SHOCT domain-containing protein [Lactobacillus crispatus]KAA8780720.1 SHOCT domain-containing protein [Lactobacillus crispatus]KAA8794866.1 SHOCT domain-containing protein [Lactobacillus crispatus]KAA8808703.1 SHOCT domain-containing protein [Lactobacillus crispatus]